MGGIIIIFFPLNQFPDPICCRAGARAAAGAGGGEGPAAFG